MLFELLSCTITAESMVAFELNRTKLTFWNRFIGRYYLIAVADNTIIFLLLSLINVLNDFGSGFFYTLFE